VQLSEDVVTFLMGIGTVGTSSYIPVVVVVAQVKDSFEMKN